MVETDAFVKRVESQLREIARRETKLSEQEDAIRRQRSELRSRSTELTRSLNVYRQVMEMDDSTERQETRSEDSTSAEGTIADIAERILRAQGRPMTTNEIVAELQRVGKLKGGGESGRGDYGTAYRTLLRDSRFARVDKGVFSLADDPNEPEPPSSQSQIALLG